ncbi:MAG: ABC transporter permease, partial [Ignavibacteria bacterium]
MNSLTRSSLRYLIKHPWQFGLSILGIAMGVAIVVSIDIANHSSGKAFNLSMNAVAGKSTHQIIGTSEGIPDSIYFKLRVKEGLKNIAPVIESYVSIPDSGKKIFKLLGVDLFAERPFRDYLSNTGTSIDGELNDFLTGPNSVVLSNGSLAELKMKVGDSLKVFIGAKERTLYISGKITEDERNTSS